MHIQFVKLVSDVFAANSYLNWKLVL